MPLFCLWENNQEGFGCGSVALIFHPEAYILPCKNMSVARLKVYRLWINSENVEKKKFDDALAKLLGAKPRPRKKIKCWCKVRGQCASYKAKALPMSPGAVPHDLFSRHAHSNGTTPRRHRGALLHFHV